MGFRATIKIEVKKIKADGCAWQLEANWPSAYDAESVARIRKKRREEDRVRDVGLPCFAAEDCFA